MPRRSVQQLYYITHLANLPSILDRGILSHQRIEDEGIPFVPVYDAAIVGNRRSRTVGDGRNLWQFANLYFQPRNPMLFRVALVEGRLQDIVVLGVDRDVLNSLAGYISLGNAASQQSEILPLAEGQKAIPEILKWSDNEFWTQEVGMKRKIMSEVLVPGVVPPDYIRTVFVANHEASTVTGEALLAVPGTTPPVVVEPRMFFQPALQRQLTPQLSLAEGDMFFSRLQTLTVSVNTVGVMGKGLASRAKYQFPDVYVRYQDACRTKRIQMGKPYLYKRESSLDEELADEPGTLTSANGETWFLLFATKHHWRQPADIQGIEEGLRWLEARYKTEGITSLAMPALGCGLGKLNWADVGPLMCRYLRSFEIPVRIYLPTESKLPPEQLTKEFLLAEA